MNIFTRSLATACLPLLPLCLAHAAFNPAVVSAEAKWVAYVDLNSLRNSTLGKELIAAGQKQINLVPALDRGGIPFDFDLLLATIGNVTAYGTNFSPKAEAIDGALIIEGTGDLRKIAEGWAAQATLNPSNKISEVTGLPFDAYSVGKEVFIGFPIEPIIVISKSAAHLVKARDVFRGHSASLAQASSSPLAQLLAKSGPAYAISASVVPSDQILSSAISAKDRQTPQARLLELVETGMIAMGEERNRTFVHAQLVAKSADVAGKLLKIVQGLVAMISLAENNDRQLAEFLASAVVEKKGQTVSIEVGYSSDRLTQMLQNAQQHVGHRAPPPNKPAPETPKNFGMVVAEWKLDRAPANAEPGAADLADRTIANVRLATGSTVTLSGQRHPGNRGQAFGNARIDRVEIFPMAGGPGLRFEAENMRLRGFHRFSGPGYSIIHKAPFASGGRMIGTNGQFAIAQFEFPGADGDYIVHVHYMEESTGTSSLAVSVRDPAPAPGSN